MLTIPTIVKNSTLKDCNLGVFITINLNANSLLIEENNKLLSIDLSQKDFNEIMFNVAQLENKQYKEKLLKILDLFNFNKLNAHLTISNLAYMNYSSNNYNIQFFNNILYSVRDIKAGEELICDVKKIYQNFSSS